MTSQTLPALHDLLLSNVETIPLSLSDAEVRQLADLADALNAIADRMEGKADAKPLPITMEEQGDLTAAEVDAIADAMTAPGRIGSSRRGSWDQTAAPVTYERSSIDVTNMPQITVYPLITATTQWPIKGEPRVVFKINGQDWAYTTQKWAIPDADGWYRFDCGTKVPDPKAKPAPAGMFREWPMPGTPGAALATAKMQEGWDE